MLGITSERTGVRPGGSSELVTVQEEYVLLLLLSALTHLWMTGGSLCELPHFFRLPLA